MRTIFTCSVCKKEIEYDNGGSGGTGYALDRQNNKICYPCCAVKDTETMKTENRISLYLTAEPGKHIVSNWPGTLKIITDRYREGRHNIAGTRRDVWFKHAGKTWHGIQYGEWSDILHCKAVKQ